MSEVYTGMVENAEIVEAPLASNQQQKPAPGSCQRVQAAGDTQATWLISSKPGDSPDDRAEFALRSNNNNNPYFNHISMP